ncbi:MAG: hypothetical protein ABR507_06145 [Actinomycetota bacterium]|nr:hypothetical protein [Actinomycetota bacterium]
MRRLLGVAITAALFLGSFAAHATTTTRLETQKYVVAGDLFTLCTGDPGDPTGTLSSDGYNVGGTCFHLDSTVDATASFVVADDHFAEVGAFYSWQDADGNSVGDANFVCNSATDLPVPQGATVLFVQVSQAFSSPAATGCGNKSAGTSGSVTASFTSVDVP